MATFKVISAGKTDVGRKRAGNEDAIFVDDSLGLHFVADGMGGHAAGEIASGTAVDTMGAFVRSHIEDTELTWPFGYDPDLDRPSNLLITSIKLANQVICEKANKNAELRGMGTTMAASLLNNDRLLVAHVGDSRVYRFRDGALTLLTQDHTWVNEQLMRNIITEEEARNHRWKNVITRALGNRAEVEVDLQSAEIEPGDIYLICSDGLTTMLDDNMVQSHLESSSGNLQQTVETLIQDANDRGGFDNISVILVYCFRAEDTPNVDNDATTSPEIAIDATPYYETETKPNPIDE